MFRGDANFLVLFLINYSVSFNEGMNVFAIKSYLFVSNL